MKLAEGVVRSALCTLPFRAARARAHDIRSEYAPDWREPGQIPYAFPKAIRVLYQWGTVLDRGMI
jgi:hypothetical protein